MISSGESSAGPLPVYQRPSPPLHYHSSPHLPLSISPPDPSPYGRFRGLRIDTSSSGSQASSSTASPIREHGRPNRISLMRKPAPVTEARQYLSRYRLTTTPTTMSKEAKDDQKTDIHASSSSTPPIDVPTQPFPAPALDSQRKDSLSTSDTSSSHTRSTSVSFSPLVTLDSGRQIPAESSLPKRRSRGRSMWDELKASMNAVQPVRAHSESDSTYYDQSTGKFLPNPHRGDQNVRQFPSLDQSPSTSSPVLQTEAAIVDQEVRSQGSTAAARILLSPRSATSSYHPTSFGATSAWPSGRRGDAPHRTQSFNFEPRRRSSRALSGVSSSSQSPASAFLRAFEGSTPTIKEPDSEGELVGGYVLGKQIGFGGFSIVREATFQETSKSQAVKIVRKEIAGRNKNDNDQAQAEFEHEVEIWRKLQHEHILSLISVWVTDFATFCFMKYVTSGSLHNLIRNNRRGLDGHLVQRYSYQLASAIHYLHETKQVVHRDIKLENCLLDMSGPGALEDGGQILLCDFGMAEWLDDDAPRNPHRPVEVMETNSSSLSLRSLGPSEASTSIAGSLQYASPEIINAPDGSYSPAIDLWAFGVVVFTLFVGSLPFQDSFQPRIVKTILKGEWSLEQLRASRGIVGVEEYAVPLVQGCLDMDPEFRLTVGQVMDNEWIEEYGRHDRILRNTHLGSTGA